MKFEKGRAKTGGRRRGVRSKASLAREAEIKKSGMTPLDFLLKTLRDPKKDLDVRLDAAKAAAPYVHPKLASVTLGGSVGTYDLTKLTDEQIRALDTILSAAETGGGPSGDSEAGSGGEAT